MKTQVIDILSFIQCVLPEQECRKLHITGIHVLLFRKVSASSASQDIFKHLAKVYQHYIQIYRNKKGSHDILNEYQRRWNIIEKLILKPKFLAVSNELWDPIYHGKSISLCFPRPPSEYPENHFEQWSRLFFEKKRMSLEMELNMIAKFCSATRTLPISKRYLLKRYDEKCSGYTVFTFLSISVKSDMLYSN